MLLQRPSNIPLCGEIMPESKTTPVDGNDWKQACAELRQKNVCLRSALEECDQIIVRVYEEMGALVSMKLAEINSKSLGICAKAQDEMRRRIADATGERL